MQIINLICNLDRGETKSRVAIIRNARIRVGDHLVTFYL